LTKCPSITCWTSKFASARPILPDQAVWGESHDVYDGTPASQMWLKRILRAKMAPLSHRDLLPITPESAPV
jgi:hypothetical protein